MGSWCSHLALALLPDIVFVCKRWWWKSEAFVRAASPISVSRECQVCQSMMKDVSLPQSSSQVPNTKHSLSSAKPLCVADHDRGLGNTTSGFESLYLLILNHPVLTEQFQRYFSRVGTKQIHDVQSLSRGESGPFGREYGGVPRRRQKTMRTTLAQSICVDRTSSFKICHRPVGFTR